jgi:cysteine desulfurase
MPLYLDHNAGSPLRPEALDAMQPWLQRGANAGSQHKAGQAARTALEEARETVASVLGGWPEEWVFTGGATEGCNIALQGLMPRALQYGETEHPAVAETAKALGGRSIPVDSRGRAQLGVVEPGALVALMAANNETGVCHPIKELVPVVHAAKGLFFCDLAQAAGKMPVDVRDWDIDLAVASATKFGGPQGSGLLWRRKGLKLKPLLYGGHQEQGIRPGTENVAGAVGLAAALKAAQAGLARQTRDWKDAVATLESGLRQRFPGLQVHGGGALRISNTLSVSFPGLERDLLLIRLDQLGLQASAGAACASGANQPSPVLRAMGASEAALASAVRFSFGWGQGEPEALAALRIFDQVFEGFKAAGLLPQAQ